MGGYYLAFRLYLATVKTRCYCRAPSPSQYQPLRYLTNRYTPANAAAISCSHTYSQSAKNALHGFAVTKSIHSSVNVSYSDSVSVGCSGLPGARSSFARGSLFRFTRQPRITVRQSVPNRPNNPSGILRRSHDSSLPGFRSVRETLSIRKTRAKYV